MCGQGVITSINTVDAEMNAHGHEFGPDSPEFLSEADTDMRFFGTSDTSSTLGLTHSSVHLTEPSSNNKLLISRKGDDMMNTVR